MMSMMNLKNTHMERFAPLLPFIRKCRKLPIICVTPLRNVSEQERELSPAEKLNNASKLQIERRRVERYFSRRRSDFRGRYSFVVDDTVAAAIAEKVVKSINRKNEGFVVEINPGMGKITQCLLQMGIKKILLCDVKQCIWSRELFKQYQKNIKIYLYRNLLCERMTNIDSVIPLSLLKRKGQPLTIIVINCNRMFIRNMLQKIVFIDYNLFAKSELYVLLSEQIFRGFQGSCGKTAEIIDYGFIDVLFDMEVLAEFPREVVVPPTYENWNKMYFVRLKRKKEPLVPLKDMKMYWNFVSVLNKKKQSCVLPSLEKWIPGCGPLLIANGMLVSTKLHELTKSDWLTIFKILSSHSDFECQMQMLREEDLSLAEFS